MIPVLRSIDSLLNRFDELSHRHAGLQANFQTNFTNIENPLRSVARDEDEQRKTAENVSRAAKENDERMSSFGTVEDFNRRITKSRCHTGPPSYSSNDSSLLIQRVPSRSSWATTESAPPPRTSTSAVTQATNKSITSQPRASVSVDNLLEPRTRFTTKIKPKVIPPNPPTIRRNARSVITTFTMETAIRLSRPKSYHQSADQRMPPKRVYRRAKPYQTIKREASNASVASVASVASPIKRTNPTTIKSSPKKLKADNKFSTDNSKRIPMSNYPRPVIFLAPPPTISLTFPMQPELKSSRVVVLPKATKKTVSAFTNKRLIIPSNRMIQFMT